MPADSRQEAAQLSAAATSRATAKYTNKDGTKFITVPKVLGSAESSDTSPAMAQAGAETNGQVPTAQTNAAPVNRKKQKRRIKQAARFAAEQAHNALIKNSSPEEIKRHMMDLEARFRDNKNLDNRFDRTRFEGADEDVPYFSDEGDRFSGSCTVHHIDYSPPSQGLSKKKKKKKKGTASANSNTLFNPLDEPLPSGSNQSLVPPPSKSTKKKRKDGKEEKIWNTTSQEERERIKEFWLSLGEEERRSLVKVEKDAVLKKMKEQQKHSCSCTVCGRKRTAIEEELEVLYDAYYEELEQYANNQQGDGPPPMLPPPRRFGSLTGLPPPHRLPPTFSSQPSRGKIMEQIGDEEDELEDAYSDDDLEEEDYLSDDDPEDLPRSHATDFFNFGNSLTVQGGILTVADDLLKNDGKKFIEMMEQLAERRMAREEDARIQQAAHANGYAHMTGVGMPPHAHNHPPLDEEEYDDEEDEEDAYDSQEDDYDDEEMDAMTEEQRMEEGRRMFQIFAARMFEQRVLTAYKEKVAKERQQKLLEELEEESRADSQRKAKRAKDAQKKKDKLQKKKEALAEEKAKKEAEKAAEEAAAREAAAKKLEEQRLKNEEKRKKREAQKKAEDEERLRREAEKQKRIQEQRERQAEHDRKQREAKEREKREREELKAKEREAKEAKEREVRERKEQLEREKREKEAKQRSEKDTKEQKREESQAAVPIPTAPSALQPKRQLSGTIAPTTTVQNPPSTFASPLVSVATPALPIAPTPMRQRQTSQQESISSGPHTPQGIRMSQSVSPNALSTSQESPGPLSRSAAQQPFLHQPQASSPIHAALKSPPGIPQPALFGGMQPMGMNGVPPPGFPMGPGFGPRVHHDSMFPQGGVSQHFRPLSGANGMPPLPGMNGMPMPQGRGFPSPQIPPGFPQPMANGLSNIGQPFGQKDAVPSQSHSRNHSFEKSSFEGIGVTAPSQPIARPAPIGRPSSVVHGHRHTDNHTGQDSLDVDDLSNHLGSSALLDDSDEPISSGPSARRPSIAPVGRQNFPPGPFGIDQTAFGSHMASFSTWGGLPSPFPGSVPGGFMGGNWGPMNGGGFGNVVGAAPRMGQPRSVAAVRLMLCRACRNLDGSTMDGWFDMEAIKEQMERMDPVREELVSDKELLEICETEGNSNNGGGFFDVRKINDRTQIRHEPDGPSSHRPPGAPGEIGSPVVGSGAMPSLPQRFPGPPGIPTPGGF